MALTTAAKPIGSRFAPRRHRDGSSAESFCTPAISFRSLASRSRKPGAAAYLPHIKGKSYEYTRCKARKTQIAAVFIRLIAVSVRLLYHNFTGFSRDNSTAACFYSRPYSRLEARFLANNGFFTTFFAQALDRRKGLCYSMYDMNSCKIASFMQIYDHFQKRFERLSLRTGRSTAARG